jgi:uncharacterized protein YvpB
MPFDPFSQIQFEFLFVLLMFVALVLLIYDGIAISKRKFRTKLFLILNSAFVIFAFFTLNSLFFTYPKMIHMYPQWDSYWRDYDKPIEVEFSRPIDTKTLVLNISPDTKGEWKFETSIPGMPFKRIVTFQPQETIYPGNKVIVYFTHVTNFFDNHQNREEFLQFNSVDLPKVTESTPAQNAENVKIDQEISFKLSHRDGDYVDWDVKMSTDDKFTIVRDNSDTIKLKFENPLKQNQKYMLQLNQIPVARNTLTGETTKQDEPREVYALLFNTVKVPLVASMSPQGLSVAPNSAITVVFDGEMDPASVAGAFTINPKVEGSISWGDSKTFVFTPTELQKATKYDVKFAKGMKNANGGESEADVNYSFTTLGPVKVTSWSPATGSKNVAISSPIKVTFDQVVDQASAQSKFLISPLMDGKFSWSGNTMIFDPLADFGYQSNYSVLINSGVKTLNGADSNTSYTTSFTTQSQKVLLSMQLYKQVNSKECQVIATQMLLKFKGISKSSSTIFSELPKQTVPCDATNNTWGDPNLGFMGEINGNHDCGGGHRGYGIYWEPISSYLSSNGISNSIKRGFSVSELAKEVEAGHPVMLWWQNGWSTPTDVSWKTPEGKEIYAVNGMHSEIAIGFVGSAENPTHIIVNDPWRGQRTLEVGYFKSLWSYFNNTGIVVY